MSRVSTLEDGGTVYVIRQPYRYDGFYSNEPALLDMRC